MPSVGHANDEHTQRMIKSATPVAGAKSILLWYANWDGAPNFNDFTPFGPFKNAFAKQYNDGGNVCGISVDLDWSPF